MKNSIKSILTIFLAVLMSMFVQSCDRAQANITTLISNDCGLTWELIKPGQTIPKRMTTCEMKTTIPSSPMTGDSHFKTRFKNSVKVFIDVDYEYSIIDPVIFISEATYLAKTNADGDEVSGNSSRFESAENSIIDKRIKDVSRDLLDSIDIIEFDQSEFEDKLLEQVNVLLSKRGVKINFISFVPEPSPQTEQAIDVATAMKIYQSKDLVELGKSVIANKAGANNIIINSDNKNTPQEN